MYMNPELKTFIEQMLASMGEAPAPAAPPTLEDRRAMFEACLMSLDAPVVKWPNTRSSATRPPISTAIFALANCFDMLSRSCLGSCWVMPRAGPRGMIVTL